MAALAKIAWILWLLGQTTIVLSSPKELVTPPDDENAVEAPDAEPSPTEEHSPTDASEESLNGGLIVPEIFGLLLAHDSIAFQKALLSRTLEVIVEINSLTFAEQSFSLLWEQFQIDLNDEQTMGHLKFFPPLIQLSNLQTALQRRRQLTTTDVPPSYRRVFAVHERYMQKNVHLEMTFALTQALVSIAILLKDDCQLASRQKQANSATLRLSDPKPVTDDAQSAGRMKRSHRSLSVHQSKDGDDVPNSKPLTTALTVITLTRIFDTENTIVKALKQSPRLNMGVSSASDWFSARKVFLHTLYQDWLAQAHRCDFISTDLLTWISHVLKHRPGHKRSSTSVANLFYEWWTVFKRDILPTAVLNELQRMSPYMPLHRHIQLVERKQRHNDSNDLAAFAELMQQLLVLARSLRTGVVDTMPMQLLSAIIDMMVEEYEGSGRKGIVDSLHAVSVAAVWESEAWEGPRLMIILDPHHLVQAWVKAPVACNRFLLVIFTVLGELVTLPSTITAYAKEAAEADCQYTRWLLAGYSDLSSFLTTHNSFMEREQSLVMAILKASNDYPAVNKMLRERVQRSLHEDEVTEGSTKKLNLYRQLLETLKNIYRSSTSIMQRDELVRSNPTAYNGFAVKYMHMCLLLKALDDEIKS